MHQIPIDIPNINVIEEIYTFVEYGGRLDHVFGIFETLFQAKKIKNLPPVFLVSSFTTDWLLQPGKHQINLDETGMFRNENSSSLSVSKHCGLVPLGNPCTKIKTSGLEWNISNNQILAFGTLISTSNKILDPLVTVEVNSPVIWTMEN